MSKMIEVFDDDPSRALVGGKLLMPRFIFRAWSSIFSEVCGAWWEAVSGKRRPYILDLGMVSLVCRLTGHTRDFMEKVARSKGYLWEGSYHDPVSPALEREFLGLVVSRGWFQEVDLGGDSPLYAVADLLDMVSCSKIFGLTAEDVALLYGLQEGVSALVLERANGRIESVFDLVSIQSSDDQGGDRAASAPTSG